MIKLFIMILLLTNCIYSKVEVENMTNYMIHKTTNEGTTGPGFFINTSELTEVSKIMKERLGIKENNNLNSKKIENYIYYENKINENKIVKNNNYNNNKKSFQKRVIRFNAENTKNSKNSNISSFEQITLLN